jgi:hypothetical protein
VRISADGAKPAQIARVRRRCEGEGGYMEEEGDCGQRGESRRKKGAVMGETAPPRRPTAAPRRGPGAPPGGGGVRVL